MKPASFPFNSAELEAHYQKCVEAVKTYKSGSSSKELIREIYDKNENFLLKLSASQTNLQNANYPSTHDANPNPQNADYSCAMDELQIYKTWFETWLALPDDEFPEIRISTHLKM